MEITERRLRQVIRQIIKENIPDLNLSKSDKHLVATWGVIVLAGCTIKIGLSIYDIVNGHGQEDKCHIIDENNSACTLKDMSRTDFGKFIVNNFESEEVQAYVSNNSLYLVSPNGKKVQLTLAGQSKEYRVELAYAVAKAFDNYKAKDRSIKSMIGFKSHLSSEQVDLLVKISGVSRAEASGFSWTGKLY